MTDVYLELGKKLVFAGAILWPGWSRSGKTEEAALEKLAETAPRYAVIAETARVPFDVETAGNFKVVELLKGTAATDFGVPEMIANSDRAPLKGRDAQRFAALLQASWTVFERVVTNAPASLRKGPRGGGRDRDQIVEHVTGAEDMYARKVGLRVNDVNARRDALLEPPGRAQRPFRRRAGQSAMRCDAPSGTSSTTCGKSKTAASSRFPYAFQIVVVTEQRDSTAGITLPDGPAVAIPVYLRNS